VLGGATRGQLAGSVATGAVERPDARESLSIVVASCGGFMGRYTQRSS